LRVLSIASLKSSPIVTKGTIRNFWNKSGAENVAALFGKIVPTRSCGSSGACCALMGCNLSFLLRDLCSTVYSIYSSDDDPAGGYSSSSHRATSTTIDRAGNIKRSSEGASPTLIDVSEYLSRKLSKAGRICRKAFTVGMLLNLRFIYVSIRYCRDELYILYPLQHTELGSIQPTFLEKASELLQVGHATHVQGFLYGMAFGCVFGIAAPALLKRNSFSL
jgi:hypothetical protein